MSGNFGILVAGKDIELETFDNLQDLAECAAFRTWMQFENPAAHVKWLRDMADKFAAEHKSQGFDV